MWTDTARLFVSEHSFASHVWENIFAWLWRMHYRQFTFPYSFREMASSWRTLGSGGHHSLSLAGWWFVTVCEPVYLFVLLRFLYRIALWWMFLWKTSRLNLQLHSVHPDGAGGLGFLGLTLNAFRLPAFAISATFAGGIADLVLLNGVPASELKYEIAGLILIVVGLFVIPLCLFYQRELSKARDRDVLNYWVLLEAQLRKFERKWIASGSDRMATLTPADFSQVTGPSSILERSAADDAAAV